MATPRQVPSIDEQREFWDWHWENWEQRKVLNEWTERRARLILDLIQKLPVRKPRMLDLGCGRGWFSERLAALGETHGIDLSPEGIAAAQARRPDIKYIAGNVYEADLPRGYFDIVVSQEVIAHVEDQAKYLDVATQVLKVGGFLIITTGNKFVMDRLGDVGWAKQPSQHIAHQVSRGQLRDMLKPRYRIVKIDTMIPHGQRGILRVVNSHKLNSLLRVFIPARALERLKERMGFGWQMIFVAQKTR
jgi:2-polyprenyl-3-methyl-5-hydroxy-6-metoxy-1,4-benzoquinol methylase